MKKLLILLAFAFLFLSLTSASSFDERKKYLLDYYSKARPNDQYWGDNDIKTAMGFVLARLETKKAADRNSDDRRLVLYHENAVKAR